MTELVYPQSIDAGTVMAAAEVQANFDAAKAVINGGLQGGSGSDKNLAANGVTARELADAILLRGLPAQDTQEGVVAAGDLRITPGANLVLNYAAGTAWVTDDSGVLSTGALIPVTVAGATVTVGGNASGNPRLDQIILTMTGYGTGTVSVLQGTANAATTIETRTGAAALPSDAVRLADILMTNGFAGPFVQATHIRDRRPWARGINFAKKHTAGANITTTSGALVRIDTTNLENRFEFSGVPVVVEFSGSISVLAGTNISVEWGLSVDAAFATSTARRTSSGAASTNGDPASMRWQFTPAAGSHLIAPMWAVASSTLSLLVSGTYAAELSVREIIAQDEDNDGA